MMSSFNTLLEGRRVLVTGGARGLGYAFAQAIAQAGARVVIADVLAGRVQQAACELSGMGLDVTGVSLDLASPESIDAADIQAHAAQLAGGLLHAACQHIGDDHPRTGLGDGLGYAFAQAIAQAAGATGDQHAAAFEKVVEAAHHWLLSMALGR